MKKIIDIFKKTKFTFIMCIITFIIGLFFLYIGRGNELSYMIKLCIMAYIPFIVYLLFTYLSYHYYGTPKVKVIKKLSSFISASLVFYYIFALMFSIFMLVDYPLKKTKYYNYYVEAIGGEDLFPSSIPKSAKNIRIYNSPWILQSGTGLSLYYIDEEMDITDFLNTYTKKAKWQGYMNEYNLEEGLFYNFYDNHIENHNDFLIYLIDSKCDNSGYCNHGFRSLVALNHHTKEVIFEISEW